MVTKAEVLALGPTLFLEADSVTGNDGDAIGTWSDESGAGRNFSIATAALKPLLKKAANGINGCNVLRFDGANDYLGSAAELSYFVANNAYTMWLIFKAIALDTNSSTIYSNDSIIRDTSDYWGTYFKSAPTIHAFVWPSAAVYTTESILVGTAYIFRSRLASGKLYHKINSNAETTGLTCGNVGGLTSNLSICRNETIYSNFDIAGIIIANTAMSAGDMATVDAYLNAKYFPPAQSVVPVIMNQYLRRH